MIGLNLKHPQSGPLRILCLGAHCDDIEIGCGGTILKLANGGDKVEICWVVMSSTKRRRDEAIRSAETFLGNVASKRIVVQEFKDGFLPFAGADVKEYFERLKIEFLPNLVLTHYRHDLHQDHRLVSDLTWNTFRNHLILEYEIPKYDGDFGSPNVFVSLDEPTCGRKIDVIMDAFVSQKGKHWFSRELFQSILRLRGMEANAVTGYAEAFYCRKANLEVEVQ
jgi:LmbE family N-acetylglucosaminyl deacetylase